MMLFEIIKDKNVKRIEKRTRITAGFLDGTFSVAEIRSAEELRESDLGIVLQALEEVSRTSPETASADWVPFCVPLIASADGSIKREASRIIGNLAERFEAEVGAAVPGLIKNTADSGTVVRWGSAYALGRIVSRPLYALSELFAQIHALSEAEENNGVKNQYLRGLKTAAKYRKQHLGRT